MRVFPQTNRSLMTDIRSLWPYRLFSFKDNTPYDIRHQSFFMAASQDIHSPIKVFVGHLGSSPPTTLARYLLPSLCAMPLALCSSFAFPALRLAFFNMKDGLQVHRLPDGARFDILSFESQPNFSHSHLFFSFSIDLKVILRYNF